MLASLEIAMFYSLVIATTLCMLLYMIWLGSKNEFVGRLATHLTIIALIANEFRYMLRSLGAFVMPIPFLLLMFIIMPMGPGLHSYAQ